ncbi:uncharacterized protein LOC127122829 [Lathyrus oleraceus]|uniref:uncharacterized protein LOC127122829 n=1 Tax=Pisum sativum TaxID=3888 RepID=UPI0021D0CCC0|nr:uncharacterized protein LOC127122829 [Pisum sativum]
MAIDTPPNGLMTTLLVYLNCPLTIYGRDFEINLVCLPLSQLDVTLGMNWMGFNRVFINYFDKSVKFLESKESTKLSFMTVRQEEMSLRESTQVFMVFASLSEGSERMITNLSVMCDFPEVFPYDISNLPPLLMGVFSINLVPGTSLVSMAHYRMSTSELSELKKQLEDT